MDIKEEIKNSIRLSEIVSQTLSLKRRDKSNYIALCPFHKEKTPSFNVSDDKGFFIVLGVEKMVIFLIMLWKWKIFHLLML